MKKSLLFASELLLLFLGIVFSIIIAALLASFGGKSAYAPLLLGFPLTCVALVWFRSKTAKWVIAADAQAWLAYRSWRRLHPRLAHRLRVLQLFALWLPSLACIVVLVFLPVASHVVCGGMRLVSHYRLSTPLNWLALKGVGGIEAWTFFSSRGAGRYGFTPIWFSHRVPSSAIFLISDPRHADGWRRSEAELARGHTTHVAVRIFRLGMITATCYEYRGTYSSAPQSLHDADDPKTLWESLCSTQPNGVDYNLRAAFTGYREDLPAFYEVLSSATPTN